MTVKELIERLSIVPEEQRDKIVVLAGNTREESTAVEQVVVEGLMDEDFSLVLILLTMGKILG